MIAAVTAGVDQYAPDSPAPIGKTSLRDSPLEPNNEGVNPRKVPSSPVTDWFMTDLRSRLPLVAFTRGIARVLCGSEGAQLAFASMMDAAGDYLRDANLLMALADFLQHAAK